MRTVLLAALALAAFPGAAVAQAPGRDSVVGSGVVDTGASLVSFALDATSGPAGEDPGGTGSIASAGGVVTCLRVSGNTALIGVDNEVIPHFPVDAIFSVVDGGPAGAGDTLAVQFLSAPPTPATCSFPAGITPTPMPVQSGDIAIHDAPPLPASKQDCKNGGWRQLGFRNQGRCVRATKPSQP
jgi:hypothetical protein